MRDRDRSPNLPCLTITLSVLLCLGAAASACPLERAVSMRDSRAIAELIDSLQAAARRLHALPAPATPRAARPALDRRPDSRMISPDHRLARTTPTLPQMLNLPPPAASI